MNDQSAPSPTEQQSRPQDNDPLPPAESADYDATHAAINDAMAMNDEAAFRKTRVKPNPESSFGQFCAKNVAALRKIQTPEFESQVTLAAGSLDHWFIDTDNSIKARHPDGQFRAVDNTGAPSTTLKQLRQQTEVLSEPAHTDGSISLQVMLRYNYGLSLPESLTTQAGTELIEKLAEMKASQALGIIDQATFDRSLTNEQLLVIQQACNEFRAAEGGTLLGRVAKSIITGLDMPRTRKSPVAIITRVIRSQNARALARAIIAGLGWSEDEMAPTQIDRLLWKAISLDLQKANIQKRGFMAGYEFAQPDNWGRNCSDILTDIHYHLLQSGKASNISEAVLAGFMMALNDYPEWQVSPEANDLPYATTCAWVNFQHGVMLAETMEFGSSRWMNIDDLIALPAQFSSNMSNEEQRIAYSTTRLPSLLLWAQANGHLRVEAGAPYSQQELEQAITAFEQSEEQSLAAVNALTQRPPQRRAMAQQAINHARRTPEIERELGSRGILRPPFPFASLASVMFVSKDYPNVYVDGNTLKFEPETMARATPKSFSLLELYMSGENLDDWRIPGYRRGIRQQAVGLEPDLLYKALPPMPATFEQSFQTYLKNAQTAYATIIRQLLASLPRRHRLAIENGTVTLYSLRLPTRDVMALTENESHREPLRGRYGFLLKAEYNKQIIYYEVFPRQMIARHREYLHSVPIGPLGVTEHWGAGPEFYTVLVNGGWKMPFDQEAYLNDRAPRKDASSILIAEIIGSAFPAALAVTQAHAPLAADSNRCVSIANTIATRLYFVSPDKLLAECKGYTSVEEYNDYPGPLQMLGNLLLKLVPWETAQGILSGERERMLYGKIDVSLWVLPYGKPIGKLLAGSFRIVRKAGTTLFVRNNSMRLSTLKSTLLKALSRTGQAIAALPATIKTGVIHVWQSLFTLKFWKVRAGGLVGRPLLAYAKHLDLSARESNGPGTGMEN